MISPVGLPADIARRFCSILAFDVCPYYPEHNWDETEQQYDEMVKYAAAMQTRTANPEAILRRFARAEVMHPTYKALSELGRAVRRYSCAATSPGDVPSRNPRGAQCRRILEQRQRLRLLRKGRRNRQQPDYEQESLRPLALHLLQASRVYVNTRMLQTVLAGQPDRFRWLSRVSY
ncbi:hypothetical protein AJ87_14860 [Rhizobium yanglingense]|nr:hypothetical protein AJ87_14860 [Rhizobium yanglingense]